jgi:hypothetical protein
MRVTMRRYLSASSVAARGTFLFFLLPALFIRLWAITDEARAATKRKAQHRRGYTSPAACFRRNDKDIAADAAD